MQTQALFYSIEQQSDIEQISKAYDLTSAQIHLYYACLQAASFYRQQQRVLIFTQDQKNAHIIDELLWAFDANSFVPHNLVGEGPKHGAPVEISWQAPTNRRNVLINLAENTPNFANQFATLIDFVPNDESLKEQARNRFRTCRQWGFNVSHQVASTEHFTQTTS